MKERRVRWLSWSARAAGHPGAAIRSREPCGAAAPAAMLGGTHECHPAPCTSTGDTYMKVDYPIISADSHITEAPNTYTDFIDPAWRDRAPHLVAGGDQMGDMFVGEGSAVPLPTVRVAAPGAVPTPNKTET